MSSLKLPHRLLSEAELDMRDKQRGETKAWPVSSQDGWPVRVLEINKENDGKSRLHFRVLYQAIEKLTFDFDANDCGRDLFYVLDDPQVGDTWRAFHTERLARLAVACGCEGTDDLSLLINKQLKIVVVPQKNNDKYTEIVTYLPYKKSVGHAAVDGVPF